LDAAFKAEDNREQTTVTRRLNEWRNDLWGAQRESLDSEDQSLWRMTKRVIRVPTASPQATQGGFAISDSEEPEAFADTLETYFHPVTDSSVPADIEKSDVALRSRLMTSASEMNETKPEKDQEAFRGLKASMASGKNGIPNRALKHLTQ
jgi:hypothetical protein